VTPTPKGRKPRRMWAGPENSPELYSVEFERFKGSSPVVVIPASKEDVDALVERAAAVMFPWFQEASSKEFKPFFKEVDMKRAQQNARAVVHELLGIKPKK
jgi:hypothetical protein